MAVRVELIDLYRNLRYAQEDISKTQRLLHGYGKTELMDNLVAIRKELDKVGIAVNASNLSPELQKLKHHYEATFNSYTGLKIRIEIQLSKISSFDANRPAAAPQPAAPRLLPRPLLPAPDTSDIGATKEYNRKIMGETLEDLKNGFYISPNGKKRILDCEASAQTATLFKSAGATGVRPGSETTRIYVKKDDVLNIAEDLHQRGLKPAVLDAAADMRFGGGYLDGARAEEERICRSTGLSRAMDTRFGLQKTNFYPLHRNSAEAGVHVITPVYRKGPDQRYDYLEEPFNVGVLLVAAFRNPPLVKDRDGHLVLRDKEAGITREKIRVMYEMAFKKGHKSIVIVPLGCGAFGNPPDHIAYLCLDVLHKEFPRCFKEVVFSVFDDHNTGKDHNPEGNFKPFARAVSAIGGEVLDADGSEVDERDFAPANRGASSAAATADKSSARTVTFTEITDELVKREASLLKLADKPLEKSFLHYEGLNPFQTRHQIISCLEYLETQVPALLELCKQGGHEEVERQLAKRFRFTVHSNYPDDLVTTLKTAPGALKEAFRVAKEKGKLDEFLVKGFCDATVFKNDGAPYDIEACLESKLAQWQLWASL